MIINSTGISFVDIDRSVFKMNIFYESMAYGKTKKEISLTQQSHIVAFGGF
jgi:hypothetical protein